LLHLHSFPTRRSSDLSMTLLTEWLFNASQLSAAMQWYDNPFLTISSVAVVFLWFAPVIDTMNAAKPFTSLLKVEFSWPAGIPKTDRKSTRLNSSHVSI